jgi:hypothetical protein
VTHTELILLLSGIAIGFDLAVAMHFGYEILDARRERKRRQARELTGSRKPDFVDTYTDPAIIGTEKRP